MDAPKDPPDPSANPIPALHHPIEKKKVVDKEWKKRIKYFCQQSDVLRDINEKVSNRIGIHVGRGENAAVTSAPNFRLPNFSEPVDSSVPLAAQPHLLQDRRKEKNKESAKRSHQRKKEYDLSIHEAVVKMEKMIKNYMHAEKIQIDTIAQLQQQNNHLLQIIADLEKQLKNKSLAECICSNDANADLDAFQQPEPSCLSIGGGAARESAATPKKDSECDPSGPSPTSVAQFSGRWEEKLDKNIPAFSIEHGDAEQQSQLEQLIGLSPTMGWGSQLEP